MITKIPIRFWFGLATITWLVSWPKGTLLSAIFFPLAWWAYIITIDGFVLHRTKTSLLSRLGAKTLLLVICSAAFWSLFETMNVLVIKNWHYIGMRNFGSFGTLAFFGVMAFGSVLPAFLETFEMLGIWRIGSGRKIPRLTLLEDTKTCAIMGVLMFAMPMFWPKYFFGTIWLGGIFLDPAVERWGGKSLFAELRTGNAETLVRILISGLLCGVIWEYWNIFSSVKWFYTVPLIGELRLFEMPIVGYVGYLPFACTCYVFCQLLATRNILSNIRG